MKTSNPFQLPRLNKTVAVFALVLALFAFNCGKKKPIATSTPAAPVAAPTPPPAAPASVKPVVAKFSIEPTTVERGQSAVITWTVSNATEIQIDNGVGTVTATGSRRVIPAESTTYRLNATGPGGDASATATVTVTAPAEPPSTMPKPSTNRGSLETRVASELQDAYFDYDSNNVRDDARAALSNDAEALKKIFTDFPNATINLEGHCDERGSAEYNLGLGDRRSTSARDYLIQLGVPADKLKTISYGKERPACTDANESCWQRNRRAHFSTGQ